MLHKTAALGWESNRLESKQFVTLLLILSLIILSFALVGRAHAGEVTLTWDANTDQNLAGYKLYFGTASKSYTGSVNVGNTTSYTLANLADGEIYYFAATAYDGYGNESDYSAELAHAVGNHPPVADAGPDQDLAEALTVTLSGANSYDPDGTIVSYSWAQTAGTAVTLVDPSAAATTFVAPYVGTAGETLSFALTVTDRCGVQATATCKVNVIRNNLPPVAVAGAGKTVSEWTSVMLDGSKSSDPDDGIASYSWRQIAGPGVELYDADLASPTFVAPEVAADGASLTFQLTVTDFGGLQATATCVVNVVNANLPPVANAGRDQTARAGAIAKLNGAASSDPDDGIASYKWSQVAGPPVTLSDPSAIQPSFTMPKDKRGSVLTFKLTVTDRGGLSSSDTCNVTVK